MGNDASKLSELLIEYGDEPWLVLRNYGLGRKAGKLLAIYLLENETGGVSKCTHLDLSGNEFDAEGIDDLIQVLNSDRAAIRELNLSHNPIGDEGCHLIRDLVENSTTLEYLNLNSCELTDEGVAVICAAIRNNLNSKLKKLDLGGNSLTKMSVHALIRACWKPHAQTNVNINTGQFDKEIIGLAPLEWLNLDNNDIQDEGADLLAFALQNNNLVRLVRLSVRSNNISNIGARKLAYMLAYCKTLAQIDLRDNNEIEENGAHAFSEALTKREPVCAGGDNEVLKVFEPEVFVSGGDWWWDPLKDALNYRMKIEMD